MTAEADLYNVHGAANAARNRIEETAKRLDRLEVIVEMLVRESGLKDKINYKLEKKGLKVIR